MTGSVKTQHNLYYTIDVYIRTLVVRDDVNDAITLLLFYRMVGDHCTMQHGKDIVKQ